MLQRDPDEHAQIVAQLGDELAASGDMNAFITTTFAPDELLILRELPNGLRLPADYAVFVLGRCLDSRWSLTPSLLERLLAALIARGRGALTPIRDRVRSGVDPMPDPTQTKWMLANMPFFSRNSLRPLLANLLNGYAQPILQVVGPDDCGKSYSRELVSYVAEMRKDLSMAFDELPHMTAATYRAEELAATLVAPTGKDPTPPPRANSSYPRALSRWVLNAALQTPNKWILVIDGFNQADLFDETRQLIQALAFDIAGGEYRKRVRLVLIDDQPMGLPNVQPAKILREQVPNATALTEQDLVECLVAHYDDLRRRGRNKAASRQELEKVATALLAGAPAGPPKRLEFLNAELTRLRGADLPA